MGDIEERLATTELFMGHPEAADAFQAGLRRAPDCERLLARAANVLAAVVERVEAAEAAEDGAALRQEQGTVQTGCPSGTQVPSATTGGWGLPSASSNGSAWALPGRQPQGQGRAPASPWAGPSHCPQAATLQEQAAPAGGQVAHLAAVLDLSQATFAPVVMLFEG